MKVDVNFEKFTLPTWVLMLGIRFQIIPLQMNTYCIATDRRLNLLGKPVIQQILLEQDSISSNAGYEISIYDYIKKPVSLRLKETFATLQRKLKRSAHAVEAE